MDDNWQSSEKRISAYCMLVLAPLFWASNHVVGRAFAQEIPPATFAFLRWIVASLIFLPFVFSELKHSISDIRKNWRWLTKQALLGIALNTGFMYGALHTTMAINAAIIMAMAPVVIPLISALLGRSSVNATILVCALISFFGIAYMISHGAPMQIVAAGFVAGDLLALMAMLLWALYSIFVKDRPSSLSANVVLFSMMLLASLMLAPAMIIEMYFGHYMVVDVSTALAVFYVAACPSVLAYFLFNSGTEVVGASRGGLFMHLLPIWTVLLSVTFLGEPLAHFHVVGLLLVGIGLYFALRK